MSGEGARELTRTLLGDSEEDYEVLCDPCLFDNQPSEAKGYCLICNENLCTACINVHRKMSFLRKHIIETQVKSKSMKCSGARSLASLDTDPLIDRCEQHRRELVKFYCNEHQALGCGVCLPFDHKNCTNVSYIRDISEHIESSEELKNIRTELRHVAALLMNKRKRTDCTKSKLIERYNRTLDEIGDFKEELISYVNEIVNGAWKEATNLRDEAIASVDDQAVACEGLLKETEKLTDGIDSRSKLGHNNALYVAVKQANSKLPGIKEKAAQVSDMVPSRFVFEREERLKAIMTSNVRLGNLFATDTRRDAEHILDLDVSSDTDTCDSLVQGISAVSGNRLAITDFNNKALKVIDIMKGTISEQIPTSSPPLDITAMGDDNVAITLKDERTIQVFTVTPRLSKISDITMQRLYAGIAYKADKFVLRHQKSEQDTSIHICATSGEIIQKIEPNIAFPSYITLSPGQDIMYVSDRVSNAVFCFDMSGDIVSTYTHKAMKKPDGIAVDEDGCVYVCSRATNSVHQMVPGTRIEGPILTEAHGIQYPLALAYNKDHLYVSSNYTDSNYCNFIKVFKLRSLYHLWIFKEKY